jgi:hypothetical protein
LKKIIVHLVYPDPGVKNKGPEVFGHPLESIPPRKANAIAKTCVDSIRSLAEERFRISPALLEPYISLDKTGTQVYGIGLRRWLD